MPKKPTAYHRPQNLAEALQLLTQPQTVPLAGGTKLLAGDVEAAVVDLQAVELNQIKLADGVLTIGATAKLSSLEQFLAEQGEADSPAGLLGKTIHRAGPNTYRNAATVGGCIASRLADSEMLAALLVLDATVTINTSGVMSMPLAAYLSDDEQPKGLITEITAPWERGKGSSDRVARTPADAPIVSVTIWQPEGQSPRVAATGTSARPVRLKQAETALSGGNTETARAAAAAAAQGSSQHPGDFRGDAGYRSEMAAVLTRRVCENIA